MCTRECDDIYECFHGAKGLEQARKESGLRMDYTDMVDLSKGVSLRTGIGVHKMDDGHGRKGSRKIVIPPLMILSVCYR